jgi:hypothetical protein
MSGIALLLMAASADTGAEFSPTASPPQLHSGGTTNSHTTAATNAIVSGGSGSYSYAWTIPESDGASFAANSPTSPTTTFAITSIAAGVLATATALCTVTDTITLETASVEVGIRHVDLRTV